MKGLHAIRVTALGLPKAGLRTVSRNLLICPRISFDTTTVFKHYQAVLNFD